VCTGAYGHGSQQWYPLYLGSAGTTLLSTRESNENIALHSCCSPSFSSSYNNPWRRAIPFYKKNTSSPLCHSPCASPPPGHNLISQLLDQHLPHMAGCDCYVDEKRRSALYCMNHRSNQLSRSVLSPQSIHGGHCRGRPQLPPNTECDVGEGEVEMVMEPTLAK